MSHLVDCVDARRLLDNSFSVIRVDDNFDQVITKRKMQRKFEHRIIDQFISYQLPMIIIDNIWSNFSMATLPPVSYRRLEFYAVEVGDILIRLPERRSVSSMLSEIYPTLNWKSISNIVNYPVNPNYLQTSGQ